MGVRRRRIRLSGFVFQSVTGHDRNRSIVSDQIGERGIKEVCDTEQGADVDHETPEIGAGADGQARVTVPELVGRVDARAARSRCAFQKKREVRAAELINADLSDLNWKHAKKD